MPSAFDPAKIVGQRFGKLTVISSAPSEGGKCKWNCLCDCGNTSKPSTSALRSGTSASCGCAVGASAKQRFSKHGLSNSPEYKVWGNLLTRTQNPKTSNYMDYGGRGIRVCKKWADSFPAFYADMGGRPTPAHTIERINNDGDYEPENCKWATRFEQARNRRNTRLIFHDGKSLTAAGWAGVSGLAATTIKRRLGMGWPVSETLEKPIWRPGDARRNTQR